MTSEEKKQTKAAVREARVRQEAEAAASRTPGQNAAYGVGCLAFLAFGILLVVKGCTDDPNGKVPALPLTPTQPKEERLQSAMSQCERPLAGYPVAATTALELLQEGQTDADAVPWKVGNEVLPATVDDSFALNQLCASGTWSLIKVVGPSEFRSWQGWVPSENVRKVQTNNVGRRIYRASDFDWPSRAVRSREAALTVMNRIMAQQPACEALDTANLVADDIGVTFSVPCFTETDTQSFSFSAADATNGRNFAPVAPRSAMDKTRAFHACEDATKQRVNHSSTVDMSLMAIDFQHLGGGQTQLRTTFTAKNSFNAQLEFEVMCDFFGDELTDIGIVEAGR